MYKKHTCLRSARAIPAFLFLACAAAPALAIDFEAFRLGAFEITPDFNTKVTPSGTTWLLNGEQQTSELLTFKPKVTALAVKDGRELSSTIEVQNGNYSAGRLSNFVDWRFENSLGMDVGEKGRVRLRTELFDSHDSVRDAFRPTVAPHFFSSGVNASYEHSAWAGRGKMVFDAGATGKDYLDSAVNTGFRDYEIAQMGSEFRFRVLPGTHMLLQYRARDIKYLNSAAVANLSNRRNEVLSYVGGTWEGRMGFAGDWRIASGYRQTAVQSYDADPGNSAWETRVRWQPLQAGVVTFDADRSFGGGFNNRPDVSSYRYNVEYQWARPLKTSLGGTWSRKTWNSAAYEDEGLGLQMRMDYAWSSWVDLFVSFAHEQRYSPHNSFDFSQQSLMLGVAASLDRLFGR